MVTTANQPRKQSWSYALCIVYVWEIKSPLYTKAKLFLLFIVTFIIIKSA